MDINILLFEGFETLDAFGPVQVLGKVEDFSLRFFSPDGGAVTSAQGVRVLTSALTEIEPEGVLFIPGGKGTRPLVQDTGFLARLGALAEDACCCLAVCTGSVLLAKTEVLDKRKATTNKSQLVWAKENAPNVDWQQCARWVTDGKFYTSSGISAGIDMALGFVADYLDMEQAYNIASAMEYIWNPDPADDPFAV